MCGKERFIRNQTSGLLLFRVQSAEAWLKWVVGFIGGVKPRGEGERVWSQIICDYQMELVNMPG
jgi:hypothetical protein